MKTLLSRKLSLVFLIVQFLISAALVGVAFYVGFIPLKYIVALIVLCLFLLAYEVFSQMTDKTYIVGRVLCALICFFYIGGGYYCVNTYSAIDEMAGQQVKVDEISCIVLKDDPAQSIYDTKDYTFGILAANDRENTNKALAEVQAAIGKEPATIEYQDNDTLIDALYAKDVKVIVINEANRSPIEEYYKTFSDDTRVLNTHKVETVIQEDEKLDDITKTPFNVYLSGIDVYGSIKATSRSDVNVIVTVNPNTKQILLTSTPRDYYVPLTVSNGIPDKLTHAGIHGVDCSIGTLENLYGIDIDYYVRVNFTSVRKIVDLLGGVKVYSDYDFTSDWGFQTNMSTKEITALAKMQLNDMSQWTIKYANAAGQGASKTTYSYQSRKLYVCVPDYNSVAKITKRINKVLKATPESVENEKSESSSDEDSAMPGDEDKAIK